MGKVDCFNNDMKDLKKTLLLYLFTSEFDIIL
jgi:hypothetical protein